MPTPPNEMIWIPTSFAPLFYKRVFEYAHTLFASAILAPSKRTVSSALRVKGLDRQRIFHRYHWVLGLVRSSREAGRVLLDSLAEAFVSERETLVVGIGEALESREGKRIYRVPCAPSTRTSSRRAPSDGFA